MRGNYTAVAKNAVASLAPGEKVLSNTPLSVAIITTPEDDNRYLPDCIRSLPPCCEIVVVQTVPAAGAQEELVHIADEGRVRRYQWRYVGEFHFARARNIAKSLCTRPWILSIDADERLMPHQHDMLHSMTTRIPHDVVACFVSVAGSMLNGDSAIAERINMPQMRMFRNIPEITWSGWVHEQVAVSVEAYCKDGKAQVVDTPLMIHHIGYDVSVEEMEGKKRRNLAGLMRQVAEAPDDAYYKQQLINTLSHHF